MDNIDKNRLIFIIAHKYIRGYISYTEYYINNINRFYENSLIIVVDNNSIDRDDIFENLKKYDNVVLLDNNIDSKFEIGAYTVGMKYLIENGYDNYEYIVMTQDNFILKNRFDFNELHKRNVTACPLVGLEPNNTFTGVQFDFIEYYSILLESLNLKGRLDEISFCWCVSFVISTTKMKELFDYFKQIVVTERWQCCASERYIPRILLELNEGENYSLDCNLEEVTSRYDCHSVDLFSDIPSFFAKRVQGKNTNLVC